jgi:hypothetical protein
MSEFDPLEVYNFIFQVPLYEDINISADNEGKAINLLKEKFKIDAYNPILKENSTYIGGNIVGYHFSYIRSFQGFHTLQFKCTRYDHIVRVDVLVEEIDDSIRITKIGQHPSLADFQTSKIKDYNKVLPAEKLKEFSKGIGLMAHGIGVGSFVYLRRIFEFLIEEAHSKAVKNSTLDENIYQLARMDEKIKILSVFLPDFLVENRSLYGILSKGIHELSENECLHFFETVKVGIELILDEKLEKFEKDKKLERVRAMISDTHSAIKNKN